MPFYFRERGKEGEREGGEGEKHQWERETLVRCLSHAPTRNKPKPMHVPYPGIEPATSSFVGQLPTN